MGQTQEDRIKAAEARAEAAEAKLAEVVEGAGATSAEDRLATLGEGMTAAVGKLAEIAASTALANESGPIKQVPYAKAKQVTPWNPSGEHLTRPVFTRNTYLNNYRQRESMISNEGIKRFNALMPGTYRLGPNVLASVTLMNGSLMVNWPNKTPEARMELGRMGTCEEILDVMLKMGPEPFTQGPQIIS